ncbi:TIGR03773 family transporter-associated surface protein [Corynebacterium pilosum]|nr:TIGR03773 family transporter-associated surface protein [Corynebacterium pilosum]
MGALLLALMLIPLPQARAQTHTFDTGHVDAFNVTSQNGQLTLDLKEDVTGQHVRRDPADVVLHVKEDAWTEQTAGIIGEPAYFLPQSQDQNLIWPGWDTLGAQEDFGAVDINFLEVTGPGDIHMWISGAFGGGQSPLTSGDTQLTSGSTIRQESPAHVHTNWAFTQPGSYRMVVQATGVNKSGSHAESNLATYTWTVGESGSTPSSDSTTQLNETPSTATAPKSKSFNGSTPVTSAAPQKQSQAQPQQGSSTSTPAQKCTPALRPMVKDDRQQPATWVQPSELTFGLGSAAQTDLPMAIGPVQPGPVHMIGSTQVPGVPWLGANTQHPSLIEHTTGEVTWELTSFEGPGNMAVYTQGNLGQVVGEEWFTATPGKPSGSHTVPANTHVHPNWVFSKPGTYKVGITQSATLKDGGKVSEAATLTFNVGGSGNADDGHFDFGAVIDPEGSCAGAGGGAGGTGGGTGGGAAGGGSSSSGGQLADTGVTSMTAALGILGLGVIVLGASYIYSARIRQEF